MPMPPQQPMPSPQVGGGTPGSATGSTGVMSQQNLNQIVSDAHVSFERCSFLAPPFSAICYA